MITTFYPPYNFGGDGMFVRRLANELARRGHRVDIIHCIDAYLCLARRKPAGIYDDHPNITHHGLKSPWGVLSPLATHQTGRPLFKSTALRKILAKGFDVIHYHNISLVGGPKILEYGRGIKLYTLHEYWLLCATHTLFRFNRACCTNRSCLRCALTYWRPLQWWRYTGLLEASVQQVDSFIAPSRFVKSKHQQAGLSIPIAHIPNFIEECDAGPGLPDRRPEEVPAEPYFLFVGRLEKLKGMQELLPVFHAYKKALLLVAGTGTYDATLRRQARRTSHIRFLGYRSGEPLQALYRGAVAVIVPSIWFDVFPTVIMEAFRQGTPAIVRDRGGMPEFIADSGGGYVYDTDDELITAMDQLLENSDHRRDLGRRAYQAYQEQWTPHAYLERYFSLIQRLAGTRGERERHDETLR
jgi:glycosyltransferase involved in cell wall biosynthesis